MQRTAGQWTLTVTKKKRKKDESDSIQWIYYVEYVLRAVAITIRNISTASSWFVHSDLHTVNTPLFRMFLIDSMFRFEQCWIANSCFKKIAHNAINCVWWIIIIVNGEARIARFRYRFSHTTNTPWFFNDEKNNSNADRRAASALYNRFNLGILVNYT